MEPDARFTLASERTYLAWIRTALALVAGGIGLHSLGMPENTPLRIALTVLLVGAGAVLAVGALGRRAKVDAAIRAGEPMPGTPLMPIATGVVVVAAALLLIGLFA